MQACPSRLRTPEHRLVYLHPSLILQQHMHPSTCPSHHDTHPPASTYLPIPPWHTATYLPIPPWHTSTCIHLPAHPTMTHIHLLAHPTMTHIHLPAHPTMTHIHLHPPTCPSHHDTYPPASTYLPIPPWHTSTCLPIPPWHTSTCIHLPAHPTITRTCIPPIQSYNLFSIILFPLAELPPQNLHTTSPPQHEKHITHREVFGERGEETDRARDVSQLDHWRQGIEALDHGSQGVVDAEASEGHQCALRMTCVVYLLHACCSHYMVYHGR